MRRAQQREQQHGQCAQHGSLPGAPSPGARESSQRSVAGARARATTPGRNVTRDAPRIGHMSRSIPVLARLLPPALRGGGARSEEHTSELQSLMRISYAVFFLKKKR